MAGKASSVTPKPFAVASYCSSTAWGGLEMNILRFLAWMRERGWGTYVYGPVDSALLRHAGDFNVPARAVSRSSRLLDLVRARRVIRQLCADNIRMLTIHQSRDILFGALLKRSSGGSLGLVYSQHMHIGGVKKDILHSWQYRQLDAWVTPLRWLADRVLEKTTIPKNKIHVIPRGIELARYTTNRPHKAAARRALNLPLDVVLAGVVGRLDPKKCQDVAVRALKQVHDAGHHLHLLIVGDRTHGEAESYADHLQQLIDALRLRAYVHLRPHRSDIEKAYAALEMFVLPSQSETYGMVTIEAMACGLPVIGTQAGGTQDLITHERNGLLFMPMDADQLARAMMRYLTDPEFAARMARRAQQDATELYGHTRQCQSWERLLSQLVT